MTTLISARVCLQQRVFPEYRAPFFNLLASSCLQGFSLFSGTPQPDDLFIAHSLGNITLLHYLSQTRPPEIGGLVLVSAFGGKLPKLAEIEGYSIDDYVAQARLDLPAIRNMTANITCIISENDPLVAPEASLKLANALQSHIITVPNAGHFLASDGFVELPQVLQAVDEFR